MAGAERCCVVEVGRAADVGVLDVVEVGPRRWGVAAGVDAAAVTNHGGTVLGGGEVTDGGAQVEGDAEGVHDDGGEGCVAQEPSGGAVGQADAVGREGTRWSGTGEWF